MKITLKNVKSELNRDEMRQISGGKVIGGCYSGGCRLDSECGNCPTGVCIRTWGANGQSYWGYCK